MIIILEQNGNEWKHEPYVKDKQVVEAVMVVHELGAYAGHELVEVCLSLHQRIAGFDVLNDHFVFKFKSKITLIIIIKLSFLFKNSLQG